MTRRAQARDSVKRTALAALRERDVLVDTGLLVALYARNDRWHDSAAQWLAEFGARLHTVDAVLAETAHLLPAPLCGALAELAARGGVTVHPLDTAGYQRIAELARKYADREPDWADLALIWLAEATGINGVATLDLAGFGVYRIHGRKAFDIVWPR